MLGAIAEADAIVVGPSNPVISIGPILAVPGMRDALAAAAGARGGGEPIRGRAGGQGPDRVLLRPGRHRAERRRDRGAYGELLDGIVADEEVTGLPSLAIDTLMDTPADRRRVAASVLELARGL